MRANLLILGGTTEASALAAAVAERGIPATLSYAGRVAQPKGQPVPVRTGGFGGAEGLARHLRAERITHLIDATHPFAATMSRNAVEAAAAVCVPLIALTRPPWERQAGDTWQRVADIPAAVDALAGPARRVMLALGRMHLAAFAARPQHHFLLRLVDAPDAPPPLPSHTVIVARGPFDVAGDIALMQAHGVDLVVAKNAGGTGAQAKLEAARALRLPVLMIDRPALPPRAETHTAAGVLAWLGPAAAPHAGTDRGV